MSSLATDLAVYAKSSTVQEEMVERGTLELLVQNSICVVPVDSAVNEYLCIS